MSNKIIHIARLSNRVFSNFIRSISGGLNNWWPYSLCSHVDIQISICHNDSLIIAITALIPIFGAFIGCIIGGVLIFVDSPIKALVYNYVFSNTTNRRQSYQPSCSWESIRTSSIWILVAVSVGASLMGILELYCLYQFAQSFMPP